MNQVQVSVIIGTVYGNIDMIKFPKIANIKKIGSNEIAT